VTKAKISEYSATAGDNTDVNGVNIAEGCPPSSMNNMGREIMAALKRFQVGSDGDGVTVGGNFVVSGTTALSTATIGPVNGTTIPSSKTLLVSTDIGVTVQGYDADTAKTDVAQTFTVSQRGTVTTDNDLSLDLSVTNNFKATPTGTATLTFTNMTAGQSGFILLDNSGAHTISAHANTKVSATALATISAAGVYILSYFTDGTDTYVVNSGALA
jgi:hypothetical protein